MAEFGSKGMTGTALGLSIGALGVEALNGGIGRLLGNVAGGGNAKASGECNDAALMAAMAAMVAGVGGACKNASPEYTRYDAGKDAEIAALKTEVEMHKAEIYTDNKLEALNDRYEKRFRHIEDQMAAQAVYNERNTATLDCIGRQIGGLQAVMGQITKTVVNGEAVCPEYMPRYNSWTAPTAPSGT